MLSYYVAQYTNVNVNWGMAVRARRAAAGRHAGAVRASTGASSKSELSLG